MAAQRQNYVGRVRLAAAGVALVLGLAACEAPVKVRGHMPDPETIAKIRPGQHGRSDVVNMLGSPSAISNFRDRTWYYIGSKEEEIAFFKPDVLERKVYAVTFGEGDVVEQTRLYTLQDGEDIQPVDRITPTYGNDLTILQQLLGNLGRFNNPGAAVPTPGGPTGPGGPSSPSPLP